MAESTQEELNGFTEQPISQARVVLCKYSAIQNSISGNFCGKKNLFFNGLYVLFFLFCFKKMMYYTEEKDDIGCVDSEKFKEIMNQIENSHNEGIILWCDYGWVSCSSIMSMMGFRC